MIVKNEQSVLARCLDSVKELADEIIIIDTGSTDKTKEIASHYTDKVFDFKWCNDFSLARNFSLSKAKMQYVMWLDADDVIEPLDYEKLYTIKETLTTDVGTVFVKYNASPSFSYFRERILKNCPLARFSEPVHEVITPFGKILYSDAAITHKKPTHKQNKKSIGRNLKIYQQLIASGKALSPRGKYYYARELMQHKRYKKAITAFKGFLAEPNGWQEDKIDAHICMAECYNSLILPKKAAAILLESIKLDAPRASACCLLGQYFFNIGQLNNARFWYEGALNCVPPQNYIGFVDKDYYEFIPSIWLAVIYDKLGDKQLAKKYNRQAASFKPSHPSVIFNEQYFSN